MADLTLQPLDALGGYSKDFGGTTLKEVTDLAILSLATPLEGETSQSKALKKAFDISAPEPGASAVSPQGTHRLLGMAYDQFFLLIEPAQPSDESGAVQALDGAVYLTSQSDSWTALRLQGERSREALARICMLDLHPDAFPEGKAARTVMEHLATIILCEGTDRYLLLSPRSSAKTFLHAIEQSLANISPP